MLSYQHRVNMQPPQGLIHMGSSFASLSMRGAAVFSEVEKVKTRTLKVLQHTHIPKVVLRNACCVNFKLNLYIEE